MQDALEDEWPLFGKIKPRDRTRVQKATRAIMNHGMRLASRTNLLRSDPELSHVHRIFLHATAMLRVLLSCAATQNYAEFTGSAGLEEWDTWMPSQQQDIADAAIRKLEADVNVLCAQVMLPVNNALGPPSKPDAYDHTKSKQRWPPPSTAQDGSGGVVPGPAGGGSGAGGGGGKGVAGNDQAGE